MKRWSEKINMVVHNSFVALEIYAVDKPPPDRKPASQFNSPFNHFADTIFGGSHAF